MLKNIVYLRLKGGVGNQLFCFAFAFATKIKTNSILYIDSQTGFKKDWYKRKPVLLQILNKNVFREANFFFRFFFLVLRKIPFITRFLPFFKIIFEIDSRRILTTSNINHDLFSIILIDGYFQSHLYFQKYRSEILKNLFNDFVLSSNYKHYLNNIQKTESVAIHVRRVDYDNFLSFEYYKTAIEFLNSKIENIKFYVFSDDKAWAFENFDSNDYVHINAMDADEVQELFLLTNCKHFIIANSTFSWWGAWLSTYSNSLVIAPKNCEIGVSYNFFPENWHLI